METVKQLVLDCRGSNMNDDDFIIQIDELVSKKGEMVCQAVFDIFSDLEFCPENAKTYWVEVVQHRKALTLAIGRPINLIAVMCDYFAENGNTLREPKLVEMAAYENATLHSTHDNLTGLYNRQYLTHSIEQHFALAERNQSDMSILFLDVDDFKDVNDTFGHVAGDDVLRQISAIIAEEIRQSDIAARYGGEEFVVLMPLTNSIEALILAERIRTHIATANFVVNETILPVSVSGGIASYPVNANNTDELLNLADSALYRAKGAGKNNISLFKKDNRRFLRIDLKKTIQIQELGFNKMESFSGISKDICVGGILFENSTPISLGTKIQLSVPIGDEEPVLLIGTVVRVEALAEDQYDIGVVIAFKEMDKLAKSEISRFLVSQARKSI